jgi:hypothetical protein
MASKAPRTRSKAAGARRAGAKLSPEARAAYGEIRQGVAHLEKSIVEIQRGFRNAEKKIEADARVRVRELRREAQSQLRALKAKQHDARRSLKQLSEAAGESWREIKQSADGALDNARATASSIVERFRNVIQG